MKLIDVLKKLDYCELVRISVDNGLDNEVDILTDWIYPEDVSDALYNRHVLKMGVYRAREVADTMISNSGLWIVLNGKE